MTGRGENCGCWVALWYTTGECSPQVQEVFTTMEAIRKYINEYIYSWICCHQKNLRDASGCIGQHKPRTTNTASRNSTPEQPKLRRHLMEGTIEPISNTQKFLPDIIAPDVLKERQAALKEIPRGRNQDSLRTVPTTSLLSYVISNPIAIGTPTMQSGSNSNQGTRIIVFLLLGYIYGMS